MLCGNSVRSLSKDLMDGRLGLGTEQNTFLLADRADKSFYSCFMLLQKSYTSTSHITAVIISIVNGAENKWAGVEKDLYYKALN